MLLKHTKALKTSVPIDYFKLVSIVALVALLVYAFLLGANQLHFEGLAESNRTINWTSSEQLRGIFNLAFFAVSLVEIALLVHAFVAAFLDFKLLKAQAAQQLRSRVSVFTSSGTLVGISFY